MDTEADHYLLDSPNVAYNPNVTIDAAARAAIVQGLRDFFQRMHGLKPEWLDFHFSNTLGQDFAEEHRLRPIGVCVMASDACATKFETLGAVSYGVMNFADDVAVEKHKTFQADNHGFSANTWEDVISGLNASFAKAGSGVRIDPSIVKRR